MSSSFQNGELFFDIMLKRTADYRPEVNCRNCTNCKQIFDKILENQNKFPQV